MMCRKVTNTLKRKRMSLRPNVAPVVSNNRLEVRNGLKKAKKAMKHQGIWKKERKEMTARIASLEAANQNRDGTNGNDGNNGGGGGPNDGCPPYAAPTFQRS